MRFFLAGIMQGSHAESRLHSQDYRMQITRLLEAHFPQAEIYDPRALHRQSLGYDDPTGRSVFFHHNLMCRQVDVLLAFVPEASMGTAIEMWEAYQHGAVVITISPLKHNWAVKFLSHALYADLPEFEAALRSEEVARRVAEVRQSKSQGSDAAESCTRKIVNQVSGEPS
jgi:hypothetical protein